MSRLRTVRRSAREPLNVAEEATRHGTLLYVFVFSWSFDSDLLDDAIKAEIQREIVQETNP